MNSRASLKETFFHDLKQYNATNFRTIENANLSEENPTVYKSFSSVVTRYFIFCERHPEISDIDKRILYFQLKLDLIAKYFSEYPDTDVDQLKAFQIELKSYVKSLRGESSEQSNTTITI